MDRHATSFPQENARKGLIADSHPEVIRFSPGHDSHVARHVQVGQPPQDIPTDLRSMRLGGKGADSSCQKVAITPSREQSAISQQTIAAGILKPVDLADYRCWK